MVRILQILLNSLGIDQTLLQVVASIVERKSVLHLLLKIDHTVENSYRESGIDLELDLWVLLEILGQLIAHGISLVHDFLDGFHNILCADFSFLRRGRVRPVAGGGRGLALRLK